MVDPYAPCVEYLPKELDNFWGKCWYIFHTWSIWVWFMVDVSIVS